CRFPGSWRTVTPARLCVSGDVPRHRPFAQQERAQDVRSPFRSPDDGFCTKTDQLGTGWAFASQRPKPAAIARPSRRFGACRVLLIITGALAALGDHGTGKELQFGWAEPIKRFAGRGFGLSHSTKASVMRALNEGDRVSSA